MENVTEVNGSGHMNTIFNKFIENVEQVKLKNKKSDIRNFF